MSPIPFWMGTEGRFAQLAAYRSVGASLCHFLACSHYVGVSWGRVTPIVGVLVKLRVRAVSVVHWSGFLHTSPLQNHKEIVDLSRGNTGEASDKGWTSTTADGVAKFAKRSAMCNGAQHDVARLESRECP